MCTFKKHEFESSLSCEDNEKIMNNLTALEIGETVSILDYIHDEQSSFIMRGEVVDPDGKYLDGQLIVTSNVSTIKRVGVDSFVATTVKGKEYEFHLAERYGVPTLNVWRFDEECESIYVDYIICQHNSYELKVPVIIHGQAFEVPGFVDGTNITIDDVIRFAPSDHSDVVKAITKSRKEYLLPLENRVGFINANYALKWHLTFENPPRDEKNIKEARAFLERFFEFSSSRDTLPVDEFNREYLDVPAEFGIGIETPRFISDRIRFFLKIQYLGRNRFYAVVDEFSGMVLEYSMRDADGDQRKLFKDCNKKKPRMKIKKMKAKRKVQLSDLRI